MQKLKSCPFCGEKVERNVSHFPIWEGVSDRYAGYCINCGARGPIRDTKEKAANAWNERFSIPIDKVEGLQRMLFEAAKQFRLMGEDGHAALCEAHVLEAQQVIEHSGISG